MKYYFLGVKRKPFLPLVYCLDNKLNGSSIALGNFIAEKVEIPLKYEDSHNCSLKFSELVGYDVLNTVGGGWLVSSKLFNLINELYPKEVQFFKAVFTYQDEICNDFHTINIFNKVECYDLEKSAYTKHSVDGRYKFSKITLKENPLNEYGMDYNIVRNSYDNTIIVSEQFRKSINSNKINNFIFREI